jgi:hypothetical protein
MMHCHSRVASHALFAAALALPLCGQDEVKTVAPTQGPVLVLKTSQAELASMMAMNLGFEEELPDVADGGHYVLSLGADRKIKVETAAGDAGLLDLSGDPAGLMELFAEEMESYKPMVQGTLSLVLQEQGVTAKDVAAFTKSLFEFPKQMQRLSLVVTGDPEDPLTDGIDVKFSLEPKAGSGFATFASAMQPSSQGVPMLAAGKNMMEMQFALAPDNLASLLGPIVDWSVGLTNQGEEQRKLAFAMVEQMMKLYDGGMSVAFNDKMQGNCLIGVLDGEKLRELVSSDDYLTMMKGQKLANRNLEMEVTPNAFEHRGLKVLKSKVTGEEPNPMMPDGSMESFFAAVGNYMTLTIGGGEANAKALIDAVADQKVKRQPIANGAVMAMVINIHSLMALTQPEMADMDMEGQVPNAATITFGKNGKGLLLHVHVQ